MKEIEVFAYDGEELVLYDRKDIDTVVQLIKDEEDFVIIEDGESELMSSTGLNTALINGEIRIKARK